MTINRFCSSGLQAIALAARRASRWARTTSSIAGGVESMSMVPMTGNKLSASPEAMERFPTVYTPMGITAENVAKRSTSSRAEQDEFALESQKKATAAREAKKFDEEIVTVTAIRFDGQREDDVRVPHRRADSSGHDRRRARVAQARVLARRARSRRATARRSRTARPRRSS